ncbi:MAG: glycosyltransferase [Desulfobacterales bacterium]|nr:glycosyltransferase [Desulfobacterales bacterium]
MIDVIVTTHNRVSFLKRTIESFIEKNKTVPYRLFIADDNSEDGTGEYLLNLRKKNVDIYLGGNNRGVVFGFDMLWTISDFCDFFFGESQYLCYLQDDLESKVDDWLLIALTAMEELKEKYNIGFFSGFHATEHPITQEIRWKDRTLYLKKSQSGQNLIAEKSFWRSIGYIPRLNPDGTERGKPNNQRGSHIDIYLTGCYSGSKFHSTHSAEKSLYNQGKNLLVLPGLLVHLGCKEEVSTWRSNELTKRL